MRRSKKLITAVVLAGVLLFASIGGIALANEGDDNPTARCDVFLERVGALYKEKTGDTLDTEALTAAFTEARTEMRAAAMQERLEKMISEGVLTEDQAAEIHEWWHDMPEGVPLGRGGPGHGRFPGKFGPCAPPAEE